MTNRKMNFRMKTMNPWVPWIGEKRIAGTHIQIKFGYTGADNFGIDLTKAAEEDRLDPIVGREREIEDWRRS